MRDPDTGETRGFGFISYESFEAADRAIECMDGQFLANQRISVSYAYKKDGRGERHGSAAERMLAAAKPVKFKPHTNFSAGPAADAAASQAAAAVAASAAAAAVPSQAMPHMQPPPMHMQYAARGMGMGMGMGMGGMGMGGMGMGGMGMGGGMHPPGAMMAGAAGGYGGFGQGALAGYGNGGGMPPPPPRCVLSFVPLITPRKKLTKQIEMLHHCAHALRNTDRTV